MPNNNSSSIHDAYINSHAEVERLDNETTDVVRPAITAMLVAAAAANDDDADGQTTPSAELITAAARQAWERAMRRILRWLQSTVRRAIVQRLQALPQDDNREKPRTVPRAVRRRVSEIAADYIREAENRLKGVPEQVWDVVRRELADGYEKGETPQQLRARVAAALHIDQWLPRVERIARTETTSAFNAAQSTALNLTEQELGRPLRRMWLAAMNPAGQPDDRVRPEHRAAHRQIVASGEPFTVGGFPMRFPGDPTAPPHLTVNCRCVVTPVLDDLTPGISEDTIQREREAMQTEYDSDALAASDQLDDVELGNDTATASDVDSLAALEGETLTALPTLMPPQLVEYWTRGEGAAKIRWGTGGDFTRCERQLRKYIKNPQKRKGACANLHRITTGMWPNERGAVPTTLDELVAITSDSDCYHYDEHIERYTDSATVDDGPSRSSWLTADTEHDVVGEHETASTEAQPIEGGHMDTMTATVVGDTDLPIADRDREWDGQKARTRVLDWATDDDGNVDAKRLSQAFLYRDPERDPETLAAYKLGFADVINGRLRIVPRGVFAAASRLNQADIPERERDRIRGRLNTLYERLSSKFRDDDIVPPWKRDNNSNSSSNPTRRRARVSEPRMIDVDDLARRLRNAQGRTLTVTDLDGLPEDLQGLLTNLTASAALDHAAIVADAVANAPENPPLRWFEPRNLEGLTPITVTARGEVFGHLAPWDVPHVGIRDENVYAPRSRVNYDLFHDRDVTTAEGKTVRAGVLLVDCDHAPQDMDVAEAREHLNAVCTPAAVVRAYEDDYGIAVTGALLPGLTVDQAAQLRKLSGEWRTAHLELMAAVGVDQAGFPIPGARDDTVAVAASSDAMRSVKNMLSHIPRRPIRADGSLDDQALAASIADELEARAAQRRREEEVERAYALVAKAKKDALAREINRYKNRRGN